MTTPKDSKDKTKKNLPNEDLWYDPMNYPAYLKKRKDETPLV